MSQAPIAACFGRRGTGKSTLAREVIRHQARILCWDYLAEHGPFALRTSNLDELEEYVRAMHGQQFAAARYLPVEGTVEEFERFCVVAWQFGNSVLLIEEAAAVCQASYLPPRFGKICRQGRHRGLGLLWTTQRLNEVSRTLTALTDYWAGFSTSEPGDLLALAQRCGREYADAVAALPRFEWLGFDVSERKNFTDKETLKALWGAPRAWRFPGESVQAATAQ